MNKLFEKRVDNVLNFVLNTPNTDINAFETVDIILQAMNLYSTKDISVDCYNKAVRIYEEREQQLSKRVKNGTEKRSFDKTYKILNAVKNSADDYVQRGQSFIQLPEEKNSALAFYCPAAGVTLFLEQSSEHKWDNEIEKEILLEGYQIAKKSNPELADKVHEIVAGITNDFTLDSDDVKRLLK